MCNDNHGGCNGSCGCGSGTLASAFPELYGFASRRARPTYYAPMYASMRRRTMSMRYGQLTVGDNDANTNNSVTAVQRRLSELGFLPASGVDGRYGPQTRDAVRMFQARNPPARVDGVVGQETSRLLFNAPARDRNGVMRQPPAPAPTPTPTPTTQPTQPPVTTPPSTTPSTTQPSATPDPYAGSDLNPAGWLQDAMRRLGAGNDPQGQPSGVPSGNQAAPPAQQPFADGSTCGPGAMARAYGYID